MEQYKYDPETLDGWKSFPVRFPGPRLSKCHSKPTFLTQSMSGGFVTANCSECGAKETVSKTDFLDVDMGLWVSCPKCRTRMEGGYVPPGNKNYGFICHRCQLFIWLADLLPPYDEVV